MNTMYSFFRKNKGDLLRVAFVFLCSISGILELNHYMPFASGFCIWAVFILLYAAYVLLIFLHFRRETKSGEIPFWLTHFRNFFVRNRGNLLSVALVVLSIVAVDMINRRYSLSLPINPITGKRERASVLSVDNSAIIRNGPITMGEQRCIVRIETGKHAGTEVHAMNMLRASMELDTVFKEGDMIQIAVSEDKKDGSLYVVAQDYYRIHYEIILFLLFAVLLLTFGGFTGLKALLTFISSCVVIWQLFVPLCLKGYDPILISVITVCILCAVIIFAVAGIGTKGWTAFLGAFLGVLSSCVMAEFFTKLLNVNGNVMSHSQPLFFAGYDFLNMTDLFIGSLFLASSGAVMDLGMDVAAGMRELVYHKPDISRKELLASGLRIGRSVVGTMSTTLLLAYTGGYLTLMMSFQAEGVMLTDILNYPYVVPEIVKTLVGSIGLVLVAPLTALVGCWLLKFSKPVSGNRAEEDSSPSDNGNKQE